MQGIYPRKGFGYYLLGTTCLAGQLAVVGYGLLTVLEPMVAAAAFVGGICSTLRCVWRNQKLVGRDSLAVVPDHIQEVFNHLARKAEVPNTKIQLGKLSLIRFDHINSRSKVSLSTEITGREGCYDKYEVAGIIGHELGHYHYSRYAGLANGVARYAVNWGMAGLGIRAIGALFGSTGSATGFVSECFTLIAANLVGRCIYNQFSHLIEKKCDQYSAVLTGCPDEMLSAVNKITNADLPHNEKAWALSRTGEENLLIRAFGLVTAHPSLAARRRSVHQFLAGTDPQVLEQSRRQIAAFVPKASSQ